MGGRLLPTGCPSTAKGIECRAAERKPSSSPDPGAHRKCNPEALREFTRYGELLMLELGVESTERLRALVDSLRAVTQP